MKHLLILICLLWPLTTVNAFWPFSEAPDPVPEYKDKITALESQLTAQAITLNHWQIATGSLGIGCVILLILGAALGSTTRNHHQHATSPRRLGRTPPTLNGRKPHLMGKTHSSNSDTTLAA